jgi:hypothetical protein
MIAFATFALAAGIASQIAGEALTDGGAIRYAESLSTEVGSRSTGTAGCEKAQQWAAAQLRALGYEPRLESYRLDVGAPVFQVALQKPEVRNLSGAAFRRSNGTGDDGVVGNVVDIGDGSSEALGAVIPKLRGAVALYRPARSDGPARKAMVARAAELNRLLADGGAVALLVAGKDEIPPQLGAEGISLPLPQVLLGRADSERVAKYAAEGTARIGLVGEARTELSPQAANVVAELAGETAEVVLIHAHLDSVSFGPGATDNAAGVGAVLEAARLLKASGVKPKRTIRFALFTGEEQGMIGSYAYLERHRPEVDKLAAALTMDTGAGRAVGLLYFGRRDLQSVATEALQPLAVDGIGTNGPGPDDFGYGMLTDGQAFFVAGVPSFVVAQNLSDYMENHHRSSDSADKLFALDLAYDSAVIALAGLQMANHEGPIGKHIKAVEVRATLEKGHQMEMLSPGAKSFVR